MQELPAIEGGKPIRPNPLRYKPWITDDDIKLVIDVLKSGQLSAIGGRWNTALEQELTKYLSTRHAITVSNGTTALHVALKAVGVGPGDEVITTPFTFAASATTILHSNAIPVFADINKETLNIDPASIEEAITDRTKAIVVVHLAGYPAEMNDIMKIAQERGLYVIEDTAQALGAAYRGKMAGSIGHVGTLSFYPTKTITTGEGGAVVTNDDEIARSAKLLRNHGETGKYYYELIGYNYRMTEFQAALGYSQLMRIEEIIRHKETFAKVLMEEIQDVENDLIQFPRPKPYIRHAWHLFQLLLNLEKLRVSRDRVVDALRAEGIEASTVAYPIPLHKEPIIMNMANHGKGCPWSCPYYGKKVSYGPLPNAEWAAERVVTILLGPLYTTEDAVDTAKAIKRVLNYYRR
ncbi:DegT/DnrJ/EryC1/StrS family aminotransferase [Vulcanisaeta souniana]|uniref:Aminotransferase DegT n=1 Tax=Vulcanisaeta souniana JCM 11219 TaxID=1293586 RepID=A0A830EIC0_9CREN|nr:DegT/DnrJ/EryC1/StrS family aminotransferase [Vulcanisaeta souniana]BDR92915.1 aminotransferase DegT [Vulcanisaeta souniana JCM 11219]GGI85564.1 aminotransferase DegT [Vulcanisaeta souniana JCM 11219]